MAFGNWHKYLRDREQVSLKKYLYVFRPLLACRWIERGLGQVPMLFGRLVEGVLEESDVLAALAESEDAAGDVEELNGFFRRYALEE